MITKPNKHQIFFILFSLILLFGSISSQTLNYDLSLFETPTNLENFTTSKGIIFLSIFLIGTLGIAHGAMDGKIIWEYSRKKRSRFELYGLYTLLVFLGAIFWLNSPIFGLALLLLMSCIHFGLSDLSIIGKGGLIPKICWGFTMTFLPVLFKPVLVNDLFYELTLTNISAEIFVSIRILTVISIFIFFSYSIFKLFNLKDKSINITFKLILFEFLLLISLAYYLEPLIWFALYFCGLHGLRAILVLNFKLFPDIFWVILFTAPITTFIYVTSWTYTSGDLLVIFPVLGSLTIAHMLLPKLKNLINA
jgi:Brp/Blh family beta-carotene 15,15'-monooxygenase|tara:strand:- start:1127 stop:2047 length:921 start_codon:yes stop_codon:yes gene_type:complete